MHTTELRYGGQEHKRFESWDRKHFHECAPGHYIVGNGTNVMRVIKPSKRCPRGAVFFIEPDCYADFFHPEELGIPAPKVPFRFAYWWKHQPKRG
jgi:hypothetical protein